MGDGPWAGVRRCRWGGVDHAGFDFNRGTWREIRPRIGGRTQVGLSVRWRLPAEPAHASGRKRRHRHAPVPVTFPAVVHDLSVSGARLLVPADDAVVLHAVLELELEGEWAPAQIVWIEPSEHESARWCGVMFLRPGLPFIEAVSRLTGHAPGSPPAPLAWEPGGAGDRAT